MPAFLTDSLLIAALFVRALPTAHGVGLSITGPPSLHVERPAKVNVGTCGPSKVSVNLDNRSLPTWFNAAKLGFLISFNSTNATVASFDQNISKWEPAALARTLKNVGANYVVLAAKHSQSFALWPTETLDYFGGKNKTVLPSTARDLVGEITVAVRSHGMQFGLYCGGDRVDTENTTIASWKAREIAYGQLHELIDWYRPSLLWNNYGWPGETLNKTKRLGWTFQDYLDRKCSNGVMNSRFFLQHEAREASGFYGDYQTVAYPTAPFRNVPGHYFEYLSQFKGLSAEQLIWRVANAAAMGGTALFELHLRCNGAISADETETIRKFGAWMSYNHVAIRGTRPLLKAWAPLQEHVRLTWKVEDQTVYAIVKREAFDHNRTLLVDHAVLQDPNLLVELVTPLGPELVRPHPNGGWQLAHNAIMPAGHMPMVLAFRPAIRFLRPWPQGPRTTTTPVWRPRHNGDGAETPRK